MRIPNFSPYKVPLKVVLRFAKLRNNSRSRRGGFNAIQVRMNARVFLILVVSLVGCRNVEPNRTDGQIPVSMQCPASQDPSQGCPSPTTTPQPLGTAEQTLPTSPTKPKELGSIAGRCELQVEGETTVRPCDEISLKIRSKRHDETRTAVVDGYNFTFTDLNERSYEFQPSSEKYELQTKARTLRPGQTTLIKMRAKPKMQR